MTRIPLPHDPATFAACAPVCLRQQNACRAATYCSVDLVSARAHAETGYCPLDRFPVRRTKPDGWDALLGDDGPLPRVTPALSVEQVCRWIDQRSPDQAEPPAGFHAWPNVQAAYRQQLHAVAADVPPFDAAAHAGRGVVIVGGGKYFASAFITLRILRHLGCTLPVEVWSLAGECLPWQTARLQQLGAIPREPDPTFRAAGPRAGWQLKAWAIAHCRFAEVLLLDSDSYPIREPSFLFDLPQYHQTGTIFWPDQRSFDLHDDTWALAGLESRDEPDVESGQIVIDLQRSWTALHVCNWMNQHADFWYQVKPGPGGIHGDKTTFHLAWRLVGAEYAMPPQRWDWLNPAMLQKDFAGNYLFVHRSNGKFALEEDSAGHSVFGTTGQSQSRNPAIPLEDFAWDALDQLRAHAASQPALDPKPQPAPPPASPFADAAPSPARKGGCCGGRATSSIAAKIAHGAAGIAKALTGLDAAPPDVIEARQSECDACEARVTTLNVPRCKDCDCVISLKVKVASEECPRGKWKRWTLPSN